MIGQKEGPIPKLFYYMLSIAIKRGMLHLLSFVFMYKYAFQICKTSFRNHNQYKNSIITTLFQFILTFQYIYFIFMHLGVVLT